MTDKEILEMGDWTLRDYVESLPSARILRQRGVNLTGNTVIRKFHCSGINKMAGWNDEYVCRAQSGELYRMLE